MSQVLSNRVSIQYDGDNGTYIVDEWIDNATFVSDNGSLLVFTIDDQTYYVGTTDWLIRSPLPGATPERLSDTNYTYAWSDFPALTLGMGSATVPALTGSGSTNIDVSIAPAMPSGAYGAAACLVGTSALLANLSVTAVAVIDADTVRVTIHNAGLLTLSGAAVVVSAGTV